MSESDSESARALLAFDGFNDFVRHGLLRRQFHSHLLWYPQSFFLLNGGRIMVDFVGRFERIEEDFTVVSKSIGRHAQLRHLNRSQDKRGAYRDAYSDDSRRIVADLYATDIEVFEYKF